MDDDVALSLDDVTCLLRRALLALAIGDVGAIDLFTEDVTGDSSNVCIRSRSELGYELLDRAGALSNVDFHLDRVESTGADTVVAWWRAAGDHTGEALFNEDLFFEPTGRRIRMWATTRVVFRRRRIAAFETIYDGGDLFDQLLNGPSSPDGQ